MRIYTRILCVAGLMMAGASCREYRYEKSGFQLPKTGDAARGKQAFVELGCPSCHKVVGSELPGPAQAGVAAVKLGGDTSRKLSDAYLLTAILNPDYHLAPGTTKDMMKDGHTDMPSFTDKMTTQQMVDVIAYIQSTYLVHRFTPNYTFE